MSTQVAFTPTTTALFSFQGQFSDGNQYIVSTPWNIVGQRYYVSVTDLAGNLIVWRALSATGPSLIASLAWNNQVTTAILTVPHNVPIGGLANINVSETGSGFDGNWQALSTGPMMLTYSLMMNPNEATPLTGNVNFPLNLVAGYLNASLMFDYPTQTFKF